MPRLRRYVPQKQNVWNIPELVFLISAYLERDDLKAWLYLNRTTYDVALPRVWRKLVGVKPLVQLMPADLVDWSCDAKFTRAFRAEDWQRFRAYADWVQDLTIYECAFYNNEATECTMFMLYALAAYQPTEPLLPNLTSIRMHAGSAHRLNSYLNLFPPGLKTAEVLYTRDVGWHGPTPPLEVSKFQVKGSEIARQCVYAVAPVLLPPYIQATTPELMFHKAHMKSEKLKEEYRVRPRETDKEVRNQAILKHLGNIIKERWELLPPNQKKVWEAASAAVMAKHYATLKRYHMIGGREGRLVDKLPKETPGT